MSCVRACVYLSSDQVAHNRAIRPVRACVHVCMIASGQVYQSSLLRAVKKTAGEGLFPMFFVDSPHPSRRDLEEVWGAAKRAGFEAYVVDLFYVGLQVRGA